jgi:hypothetical protein
VLLARAAVRRACQRAWRARNGWTGQHGDGRVDVWARASWRQRERETTEGDHRICMGVVEGRRRQGRVIWRLWPVGVAFAFYLAAASRPKITPAQQYKYPATRAPRKALFFTSAYLPPLLGPSSLALATNDAHAWVLHFAQTSRPLWASPAQQPGSRPQSTTVDGAAGDVSCCRISRPSSALTTGSVRDQLAHMCGKKPLHVAAPIQCLCESRS